MAVSAAQVREITGKKLYRILSMGNSGEQKAILANLRRGAGHAPGDMPELWGVLLGEIPEEMMSRSGKASRAEWAIYTAMTLFAVHQQGKDSTSDPMHKKDCCFGSSVAKLIHTEDETERVLRRFNIAVTADDIAEAAQHLRGLIQLLQRESIPLDYSALAADLYMFQFPEYRSEVRLRWGQDFYREKNKLYSNESEDNKNE